MRGAIRKSARPPDRCPPNCRGGWLDVDVECPRCQSDELRERDERLLDADAERWVADWGGDA